MATAYPSRDLGWFYSLRLEGGRVIDDHVQAARWFERQIGAKVTMAEPCLGALQLRHIFGKFVDPNGQPKRASLDRKGLLSGKQFSKPEEGLDASIRYGYPAGDDFRGRITRVDGPAYSELITFVSDRKVSPGIRQLLIEVCERKGCARQLLGLRQRRSRQPRRSKAFSSRMTRFMSNPLFLGSVTGPSLAEIVMAPVGAGRIGFRV